MRAHRVPGDDQGVGRGRRQGYPHGEVTAVVLVDLLLMMAALLLMLFLLVGWCVHVDDGGVAADAPASAGGLVPFTLCSSQWTDLGATSGSHFLPWSSQAGLTFTMPSLISLAQREYSSIYRGLCHKRTSPRTNIYTPTMYTYRLCSMPHTLTVRPCTMNKSTYQQPQTLITTTYY